MYFHSIPFFCFLFLVAYGARFVPTKDRWGLFLGASWLFYAWHSWLSLGFLCFVILFTFRMALAISEAEHQTRRRFLLWATICVNVGLIGLAKYFLKGSLLDFVVPLGLSFYTFQATGYLIDVYRGQQAAERHLGRYALFVSFFPTLLSGPIERASTLLPQFVNPEMPAQERVSSHVLLFYSGLFKKLVVADALAKFVAPIFNHPEHFGGVTLFLGIAIARYMIFADFSGYADMAVASAGLLGVQVRQNFRRPFFATSLIDYWRRWHISLHDWMKDYVFFSLSTTAVGRTFGIYFCLIVSFLFMGIWHDVGWTFLAVGLWHGVFISLDYLTRNYRERIERSLGLTNFPILLRLLQTFATLIFFILPPTVFFLSKSISDARRIFGRLFSGDWNIGEISSSLQSLAGHHPASYQLLIQTLLFVGLIEFLHILQSREGIRVRLAKIPRPLRYGIYLLLFVLLVVFAQPFGERTYVYFQF